MEMALTVSTVPDALRLLRLRHQDSENIDNQDAEKTLLRGSNQPRGWVEAFLYLLAGDCEESGRIDLFASDNYDAFATVKCEGMYSPLISLISMMTGGSGCPVKVTRTRMCRKLWMR